MAEKNNSFHGKIISVPQTREFETIEFKMSKFTNIF